ncbi:hypothetical protein PYW07_008390 [Mythimna separata]|uniref:RNA-directed DNA polymerase n=1 Tax=Mythimna separata TaxID=271217 RepID=A0AAD7YDM9_MYTSE|nr:hypothetical protein PYW07_008390 [Mythimna separata]
MVASRMQRWAIILSAYTYDIEYVKTNENGADGLSRLPVVISERKQMSHAVPEQTYLHFIQQALLLDYEEIRRQTGKDPLLSKILSYIRDGWPTECNMTSLQPFFNRQKEIYEELGCVLWGHRLVVPENCKEKVLHMLHEPHMGIVKSKAMARSYVWWAGLDEAVERMCRACELCAAQADAPPRQAPCMWPWPNRAWSRLHLDFMGPIFGKTYLITVDATSKWVEVFNMTSTTAGAVIDKLCELFSKFGLPKQIVSDNGPPFTSTEFHNFASNHGIEHIFTAPYHPASNGLAENAVKTFKRVIKKAALGKQNIDRALWTYLLHYRNTAHSTTGESPAMLLLGRRLRTKLDVLKPDRETSVAKSQKRQKEAAKGGHREVGPDEEVWYRQFLKGEKWVPGQVVQCVGPSNYKVRGSGGEIVHRHIDQIKRRSVRQSLMSVPEIDQQVVTNPGLDRGNEPSVLREGVQSAQSTDEPGLRSPPPARELGEVAEAVSPAAPPSPEFQDALPSVVSPQPQERLVRQCRIKNKHNYKI